ncbi:MAG: hypothetical protein DMD60_07280 [Gemmatimonadetes bacterium]|nr:MAG: hypothetical protein DMD60_07280 [Gemmatimonadota bacterium]
MTALRNILVAVRPGSLDSHPLRSAMAVATRARARLSGLSVAPSPRARAHIESTLAEGIPMHTALGIPAIEIVREAESKGTDLLVLGRELSPQMDLRHDGNTVEGTVRRARIPCLVVPRGQEKFGRVLAAVDGGPDSRDVMAAALLVGRLFDASVRAVQVEAAILAGVGASTGLHEVPPAGGDETIICQGDPVSEILRVVRDEDVDLLVFGHHRGGPISSHATSGVAARLLQRAPCAVLTVPI